MARGLIFASVGALAVALFPFFPKLEEDLRQSQLGPHVIRVAPAAYGFVMEKVRGRGYEGLDLGTLADEYLKNPEERSQDEDGPATDLKKEAQRKKAIEPEKDKPYYERGE